MFSSQKNEDENILKKIVPDSWRIVPVSIRWHSLKEQVSFLPILYKEQLDLMHFPYFSLPVLYHRPFVVTIHDLIIHSFSTGKASTLPLPLYQMKRFAYKRVIEQATKHAKKVIVPLNAVKKEVEETLHLAPDQVVVTKEGFDSSIHPASSLKPQVSSLHNYFLYVGNAYPHKNVEKLLKGFMQFQQSSGNENYSLVLVGKEDYFSKRIKENFKEHKNIIFLHKVSDSELGYLYNHAIALVSASLMEGFGLPCLEAAECECLVAVSDIPSFREVCGENALYFSPNSIDSIADVFSRIVALEPEKKKELIRGGKRKAETFSWEAMTRETIRIYESCTRI